MTTLETIYNAAQELDKVEVTEEVQAVIDKNADMIATGILLVEVQIESGFLPQALITLTHLVKQACQIGYNAGRNSVIYKEQE